MSCRLFASMRVSGAQVMLLTRQRLATSCSQRSRATQGPSMRAVLSKHASEAQRRSKLGTMPTPPLSLSLSLSRFEAWQGYQLCNSQYCYQPCLGSMFAHGSAQRTIPSPTLTERRERARAHREASMACPVQPSQSPGMGAEGSMACARRRCFCLICLTEAEKQAMSNVQPSQSPTMPTPHQYHTCNSR